MRLLLFAVCLVLLSACASTKPSPVFRAPSLAPITTAVSKAQGHVGKARTHADKAKQAVADARREAPDDRPALRLALDAANHEIDALSMELGYTQEALSGSQTAVKNLAIEQEALVAKANEVAGAYSKEIARREKVEASRHRWVKFFWYSFGLNVAAGLWIFRKPLFAAVGGAFPL